MKKVIVTGANGFIGTALLWEMSKQNIKIYAVIKDKFENIDHIKDIPGVEIVYCSQENIFDLPKLINERDIIYKKQTEAITCFLINMSLLSAKVRIPPL